MKTFYIVGNPVNHSLSPKLFQYIFNILNINAKYLSYQASSMNYLMTLFRNETCNISGLNITMPYKIEVYNRLNNHDTLSEKIKSTNCIKNLNNKLVGYNTDYYGFTKMFTNININQNDILILGNGGLAQTVVHSLLDNTENKIYVWGRNNNNLNKFINIFNSKRVQGYSQNIKTSVIINCLPINMIECDIDSIIDKVLPEKLELFIDLNYIETLFTQKLSNKNYNVIFGLDMFIFQALKSFDIWFDNKYHDKITHEEIKNLLSNE